MSFVKDVFNGLTGKTAAQAAGEAAGIQSASADKAIDFQKETLNTVRGDLAPYKELGNRNISRLESLITDPNAQKDYVTNNPFFDALAKKSTDTLLNNAAAKGKIASGGTAEALQNSLLLLGQDLLNNNINQTNNLVNIGQNSAAGTASATQNTGNNISNLITGQGDVNAAGIVGKANAKTSALQNLLNTGGQAAATAFALCDMRMKENIELVGSLNNGLPLYSFNYIGDDQIHINVMAQDVEKVKPDAVIELDGIKYVNMRKVCH